MSVSMMHEALEPSQTTILIKDIKCQECVAVAGENFQKLWEVARKVDLLELCVY